MGGGRACDLPDAGGGVRSCEFERAGTVGVGTEGYIVLAADGQLCFGCSTDVVEVSGDVGCTCMFQLDAQRRCRLVVEREGLAVDGGIGIVGQLRKGDGTQCVVANGYIERGGSGAGDSKLDVDGHIAASGVAEIQLVSLLGIIGVIVIFEECASGIDEGEGVFLVEGMSVVSGLFCARSSWGFRLTESGRSASRLGQEVVDVAGIGVVAMREGAAFILARPLGRSAGIEEDGAVAFAVEGNFGEVIVEVFNLRFRQERQVVAIEADLLRVAETHALEIGTRQLIHTFVRHPNLHPLARGKSGMLGIARLGTDANGQYPYNK